MEFGEGLNKELKVELKGKLKCKISEVNLINKKGDKNIFEICIDF